MGGQVKKNARTKNGKGGIQVSSKSSRTQQQKEMLNREDAVSRRLKKKGESDQSRRKKKKKNRCRSVCFLPREEMQIRKNG